MLSRRIGSLNSCPTEANPWNRHGASQNCFSENHCVCGTQASKGNHGNSPQAASSDGDSFNSVAVDPSLTLRNFVFLVYREPDLSPACSASLQSQSGVWSYFSRYCHSTNIRSTSSSLMLKFKLVSPVQSKVHLYKVPSASVLLWWCNGRINTTEASCPPSLCTCRFHLLSSLNLFLILLAPNPNPICKFVLVFQLSGAEGSVFYCFSFWTEKWEDKNEPMKLLFHSFLDLQRHHQTNQRNHTQRTGKCQFHHPWSVCWLLRLLIAMIAD